MATKKQPLGEHAVRLRIVADDPVSGVLHSLQDGKRLMLVRHGVFFEFDDQKTAERGR